MDTIDVERKVCKLQHHLSNLKNILLIALIDKIAKFFFNVILEEGDSLLPSWLSRIP